MVQEPQAPATTGLVHKGTSVLLQSIHPLNLLSFGPDTQEIPLGPLNVLVGANGSGKSNLIEIICLLRSTAYGITKFFRDSGGSQEWQYKGASAPIHSTVSAVLFDKYGADDEDWKPRIYHSIMLYMRKQDYYVAKEKISTSTVEGSENVLTSDDQGPLLYDAISKVPSRIRISNDLESVLIQLKDEYRYPHFYYLTEEYNNIRAYREWSFGRNTIFRTPQRADMPTDHLEEDFSNLGLFLNKIRRNPQAKNAILTRLRDLYEGVDDYDVSIEGGTVQVFLTEGNITVPATRLSDGTLRYLCLLAILCDPTPPPLICLEEPELGLHPDILPKIADLLVEASTRTQLIVTTHSEIIIDALTDRPECVLVCEKHEGQTRIERLSREDLSEWLTKYRLGELWMRGEIGGKRW